MEARNTADTHIFLALQGWTWGEKLEISSSITAALEMSLCLPSPLLAKWGTRARKQHFRLKILAALCGNAAEGWAKGAVEARRPLFKPKYRRAVPIAILIPQMSIAMPQGLWRSFVMEKTPGISSVMLHWFPLNTYRRLSSLFFMHCQHQGTTWHLIFLCPIQNFSVIPDWVWINVTVKCQFWAAGDLAISSKGKWHKISKNTFKSETKHFNSRSPWHLQMPWCCKLL